MGTLVFVCPNSGREVFTGLEIDSASFQGLPKLRAEINCSDCGGTHNLFEVRSRLVATPPEGSNTPCQEHPILSRIESMSAGQIGEQHPAFVAEPNLMAILNGLIVAVFLILLVASVAVVGSMIALTLFDLALSRKRPSGTTAVIDSDPEITNRSNLEMAFSNWRRERGATEED